MWKPLSIVSGLVLVGAGGLMFFVVKPQYQAEMKQRDASIKNLELAKANLADASAKNTAAKDDLDKSTKLLDKTTIDKNTAKANKATAVKATEDATVQKDAEEKRLTELTEKLKGLGGLDEVVAKLKGLEAKKAQLESEKQNTMEATTALVAHKEATDKVITDLKLREIYQKTGTVRKGTTTRVVEASQELGFFVLAGGNSSNITKNSKWDVIRGDSVIARLVVTHIEQKRSIAELVPGTLAAGNQVLPGDRVVVNAGSTPEALAASITAAAKKGAAAPGKGAAKPEAGAPAPEAPVSDPFATPGGTTPPMEKPAETTPAPAPETTPAPAPETAPVPPAEKPAEAPKPDAPKPDAPKAEEKPANP